MKHIIKKNRGPIGRTVRNVLVVVVGDLYMTVQISGVETVILALFAAICLTTCEMGFCPLYVPIGISTIGKQWAL